MIPSGWSSAFPHNGQPAIFSLLQCCPVNPLSRGKDFPSFPLCRGRHTPIFPSPSKGPVLLLLTYLRLCRTNLTLTYHVKFCLPCDVKNCLPNNVKNSLPTNVKISLPYHVKNCLPSHVKKCLTFAPQADLNGGRLDSIGGRAGLKEGYSRVSRPGIISCFPQPCDLMIPKAVSINTDSDPY